MTKIYESNDGGKTYSVRESNLDEIKMIEISDEEIEKRAKDYMYNDMIISVSSFISGAKWYREQLKKKQ